MLATEHRIGSDRHCSPGRDTHGRPIGEPFTDRSRPQIADD
jgi:hypothetical protein